MEQCFVSELVFALRYQFKKNKVRDCADSDSDCDDYDLEDRGLILRQVLHCAALPRGIASCFFRG